MLLDDIARSDFKIYAMVKYNGEVRRNVDLRNITNRDLRDSNLIILEHVDGHLSRHKDRYSMTYDDIMSKDAVEKRIQEHIQCIEAGTDILRP